MIRINTIIVLFVLLCFSASAGIIVLEGHYQRRNIYVQNTTSWAGVGFCIYEVSVNGNICTDELNTSAFEIDLSLHHLKVGAAVTIMIKHKNDGCQPKILNPEALKPNPTFETIFITVDNSGMLKWTAVNETTKMNFIVEQFKWNKWVQVGETMGAGVPTANYYTYQTSPHAGLNKFRVKQKGYIDKTRYTPSVSYTSLRPEVLYIYIKDTQTIEFSENTSYEMYDKYGNIIKKGFGGKMNVSNLKKDIYYFNYGNSSAEFKKK